MVKFAQEEMNMGVSFDEIIQHIELYDVEDEGDDFFDEKVYFE